MRRIDIINSVQTVGTALTKSGIIDVLGNVKKNDLEIVLGAFQSYTGYSKQFSKLDRTISVIFKFEELEDPKFWARILASAEQERDSQMKTRWAVRFFLEYLPNVVELLKQDHINYTKNEYERSNESAKSRGKALLTVILPENDREISNPERLIKALESINLFYKVFSIVYNDDDMNLSVAAIDSGSDKSFDFLGAAKLMEAIKELIISLWDRIVFHRERQLSERLDLVTKSLPIIEKIAQLQEAKTITPEQAEILRRDITTATINFITVGAIIPELDDYTMHSPRQLMAAEPKLLNTSKGSVNENNESNDPNSPNLANDVSDEEFEILKKFLGKRKPNE